MATEVHELGVRKAQRLRRVVQRDGPNGVGPLDQFVNQEPDIVNRFPTEEERRGLHRLIFIKSDTGSIDGTFIAARVSKLQGDNDETLITLQLGANSVVHLSYDKAKLLGLKNVDNPSGIVLHEVKKGFIFNKTKITTLTIGFPTTLFFPDTLELFAKVKEKNVSKIEAVVVWGTDNTDGEPINPSNGEDPFP